MKATPALVVGGIVALTSAANAQSTIIDSQLGIRIGSLATISGTTYGPGLTGGYQVKLPGFNSALVIALPAYTSWAGYGYVDVNLRNNGTQIAMVEMDIASGNGRGWMSSKVVLRPGETTPVSMPLKSVDSLGLRAFPTFTDSSRNQTASVGNFFNTDVRGFYIWSKDSAAVNVSIEAMALGNHTVPTASIVDTFGQQRGITWANKATTGTQLVSAAAAETLVDAYPYAADAWGGITGGKNYGVSTKFRTIKDNGHWFLADPAGNRFFSLGVNEVGAHAWTPVQGRETLFTDLANLKSQFPDAWSVRDGVLGYLPYQVNLRRKYGPAWRSVTEGIFTKRMKYWGFNTLGANCWDTMVAGQKLSSTFIGEVVGPHKTFVTYDGRSMPDVFDPQFASDALTSCQNRMTQTGGNNPKNLGIFMGNEMPWGSRSIADPHYRYGLAVGALNASGGAAHSTLLGQLKTKYVTIAALNTAWGTTYAAWTTLDSGAVAIPAQATAAMATDFAAFGGTYAKAYFSTIKNALNQLGFKGLFLGCRFTVDEYVPEVLDAAKLSCDVLSFNVYHADPQIAVEDLKSLDFPIMFSEFAFGATDQGRVGVPLYPTQTESARMDAYKLFIARVRSWPNVVGAHWYRWEDFPVTGKVDGDNMSEGLISIVDNPYSSFISTVQSQSVGLMNYLKSLP